MKQDDAGICEIEALKPPCFSHGVQSGPRESRFAVKQFPQVS